MNGVEGSIVTPAKRAFPLIFSNLSAMSSISLSSGAEYQVWVVHPYRSIWILLNFWPADDWVEVVEEVELNGWVDASRVNFTIKTLPLTGL